jgi:uncharacterized protein (TIGR00369 family)
MAPTGGISPEEARQVLAAQPFSRLLGARLTSFGPDGVVLELDVRDELRQQHGFVHGGVLSYAADNAVTFAGGAVLGPRVLTGGLTITYLSPARGGTLRATACAVHAGRRQAVCRCEIHVLDGGAGSGEPALCAVAQGTVVATRAG